MIEGKAVTRLALTAGEPAGIGPDLCLMLAQKQHDAQVVVIADPELLGYRASLMGVNVRLTLFNPADDRPAEPGELLVHPVSMGAVCKPGQLNSENSHYVMQTLETAVKGCVSGLFHGMVTAPIHKQVINDAGIPFTGHTEFLAKQTGVELAVMMLVTEGLRVALVTTHLPLSKVAQTITQPLLTKVLEVIHYDMQHKFLLASPSIFVCGLNPHAGEGGQIGREEIEVITPVIENLNSQGMNIVGPLSADTLFHPNNLRQADVVLAMYHDQGLPVLKYLGFGNAVNVTLGLPIIRTSVDHGTALDLAGTGKAQLGSLALAVITAVEMIDNNVA